MAVALVQSKSAGFTDIDNPSAVFDSAVTAGSAVVAGILRLGQEIVNSFSGGGGSYLLVPDFIGNPAGRLDVYVAANVSAFTNLSASLAGADSGVIFGLELSGVITTDPRDDSVSGTDLEDVTSFDSGNITTTTANSGLVGFGVPYGGEAVTTDPDFTPVINGVGGIDIIVSFKALTATGTHSFTFTTSNPNSGTSALASFKGTGGGGGGRSFLLVR